MSQAVLHVRQFNDVSSLQDSLEYHEENSDFSINIHHHLGGEEIGPAMNGAVQPGDQEQASTVPAIEEPVSEQSLKKVRIALAKCLLNSFLASGVFACVYFGLRFNQKTFVFSLPAAIILSTMIDIVVYLKTVPASMSEAKSLIVSIIFTFLDQIFRILSSLIFCLVVLDEVDSFSCVIIPISVSLILEIIFFFYLHDSPSCFGVFADLVFSFQSTFPYSTIKLGWLG